MTFGLCNAAQTFQRFINEVLHDLDFCVPYFDDVLVASTNEKEHLEHLRLVFDRFQSYGVVVNPSKCVLGESKVSFLGHEVSSEGVRPLSDRVTAIQNFPEPQTVQELRRFLAMINFYRRFLPHAAEKQAPLHAYLVGSKKKDTRPIIWTEESRKAFVDCKYDLVSAVTLSYPSESPLALMVDASNTAMGAVLQQLVNGAWKPLAFFSKKFSTAQSKYSTYDRELLSAYEAVKHFRHMVEGRLFSIYTDHKPLIFAFQQKADKASPRQMRHLDYIAQFTTDIRHVEGPQNTVADALSRIEEIQLPSTTDFTAIAEYQKQDPELKNLLSDKTSHRLNLLPMQLAPNLSLYCDVQGNVVRPYIPFRFRHSVFSSLHNLAHPGIRASRKLVQQRFVWPGMLKDIAVWSRACVDCQKSKIHRHTKTPLQSFDLPSARFSHVHIDLVGPLPPSQGYTYLFTCVDRYTRWPEAIPLVDMSADTVAKTFFSAWISRYGVPEYITSDQGRQFESQLFTALTKFLGTKKIRTSPYHPSSNGLVERFHRSLKQAIRCHTSVHWVEVLPIVLLGLRTAFKEDLGSSCAEMVYGTTLRLPGDFLNPTKNSTNVEPHVFLRQLRETMATLSPTPTSAHSSKSCFIPKELATSSHVFLRCDASRKSLEPTYSGPYPVLHRSSKNYRILIGNKETVVSLDRLKPAFVFSPETVNHFSSTTSLPKTSPPPPVTTSPVAPEPTVAPESAAPEASVVPDTLQPSIPNYTRSGRRVKFNPRYL